MVLVPVTLSDLSRLRHCSMLNNLKMVQDRAMLTMADQEEITCDLSNGAIS